MGTYSGTVETVQLDRRSDPFEHSRYAPNSEYYAFRLRITLRTSEGIVEFETPKSVMSFTLGGGAAVCTFRDSVYDHDAQRYVFPADHPWFRRSGEQTVATADRAADATLVSKIAVGDSLTVRGCVKARIAGGVRLNRVKLISRGTEGGAA